MGESKASQKLRLKDTIFVLLIWSVSAEKKPNTLAAQYRLLKYYLKTEVLKKTVPRIYTGPDLFIYQSNPQIKR